MVAKSRRAYEPGKMTFLIIAIGILAAGLLSWALTRYFLSFEPLAKFPAAASVLVAWMISFGLRSKKSPLHR